MVTKKWKKIINSLHSKKQRVKHGLFLVEGLKSVAELADSDFEIELVCSVEENEALFHGLPLTIVDSKELEELSSLSTNNDVLAVAKLRTVTFPDNFVPEQHLTLLLDGIQDPGNLGTIIRTADWYGVKNIICSGDCVDFYNSKVIQATMGSFTRLQPLYHDLKEVIQQLLKEEFHFFGAVMDGKNIHDIQFQKNKNVVVLGNESNGITPELLDNISEKISIPRFGEAESLNVAIANGIICDRVFSS